MAELPEKSFENFLSTLHFTALYLQRFIDTGYDDIDLLIDATKDDVWYRGYVYQAWSCPKI